jgi:hypothetical protein
MEYEVKMKPVAAIQDETGDWFVIPKELVGRFMDLEETSSAVDKWDLFESEFGEYRTGGDLNLIQLYAEI